MKPLILVLTYGTSIALAQSNLDNKVVIPVQSPTVAQKFACHNCLSPTSGYHTGQDLISSTGDTNIYAAGYGKIVTLQVNGQGCSPGCNKAGCGCLDHGLGNAVILEHTLLDGTKLYSLYGHNSSFAAGLSLGKCVVKGAIIATVGGTGYGLPDTWKPPHSHFELKTADVLGAPDGALTWGYTPDSPTLHGYLDPANYIGNIGIWDASAENFRTSSNQVPHHPIGTLVRKRSDGTIYVVVGDTMIRGITDSKTLSALYPNGGFGLESVIIIGDSEFGLYQIGSAVSSSLPWNNRARPDGTLIVSPKGEISIITNVNGSDGGRRPFSSAAVFSGLGYSFCNAISISQQEYDSFTPIGPIVDGTSASDGSTGSDPDITRLANSSPQVQWFYIQSATGRWYIVSNEPTPQVLALAGADRSFQGIIKWRPISNSSAYAGYPSAANSFSFVSIASNGKTINFGGALGTDPEVFQLANTTQIVRWFYIFPQSAAWYIVDAVVGSNPAVLKLQDADPTYQGLILWKPIHNFPSAVGQYPAAGNHYSSVVVTSDGRSVQFGAAQ